MMDSAEQKVDNSMPNFMKDPNFIPKGIKAGARAVGNAYTNAVHRWWSPKREPEPQEYPEVRKPLSPGVLKNFKAINYKPEPQQGIYKTQSVQGWTKVASGWDKQ